MNRKTIAQAINTAYALKPIRQNGKMFHVCFVYLKRKCISIKTNKYYVEPNEYLFGQYVSHTKNNDAYRPNMHAELNSVLDIGQADYSKFQFLVLRLDKNNELNNSKPCKNCQRVLNMVGVNKVYYSNEHGKILRLK